jgi:hypothetical protein
MLIALFTIGVRAQTQDDKPQPDRWRGLILDQSTPEDAIRILGQPDKDKIEAFKPYPLEKRFNLKGEFRYFHYKKLEGIEKAALVFTKGKLVAISLQLTNEIPAAALQNIYGVEFEPKFSSVDAAFHPGQFERNQGKLYAKSFPGVYMLIARADHSYVSAMITQNALAVALVGGGSQGSNGDGAFPGKTKVIQLISRSLETHEGEKVLK